MRHLLIASTRMGMLTGGGLPLGCPPETTMGPSSPWGTLIFTPTRAITSQGRGRPLLAVMSEPMNCSHGVSKIQASLEPTIFWTRPLPLRGQFQSTLETVCQLRWGSGPIVRLRPQWGISTSRRGGLSRGPERKVGFQSETRKRKKIWREMSLPFTVFFLCKITTFWILIHLFEKLEAT